MESGSVEKQMSKLVQNIAGSGRKIAEIKGKERSGSFREAQNDDLLDHQQRRVSSLIRLLEIQAEHNIDGQQRQTMVYILSYPGEVYHPQSLNRVRIDLRRGEDWTRPYTWQTSLGILKSTGLATDSLALIDLFGEYHRDNNEPAEEYVKRSFSEVERLERKLQELGKQERDSTLLKESPAWQEGNHIKLSLAFRLLEVRRQASFGEVSLKQQIRLVRLTTPGSERDLIEVGLWSNQKFRGAFRIFDPKRYEEPTRSELALLIEESGRINSKRPRYPNPVA
ncbi:hypothetical protein HYT18_02285 [Candidatus Microgenomates bacterium]|nr:hypothetical protein [Candidatus Microgenomates bacterium]